MNHTSWELHIEDINIEEVTFTHILAPILHFSKVNTILNMMFSFFLINVSASSGCELNLSYYSILNIIKKKKIWSNSVGQAVSVKGNEQIRYGVRTILQTWKHCLSISLHKWCQIHWIPPASCFVGHISYLKFKYCAKYILIDEIIAIWRYGENTKLRAF